ncbi:MAG: transcriptional regulator [Sphingorhabdus sp.]
MKNDIVALNDSSFAFDRFLLDGANRQLVRGNTVVEINSRYLDALLLLVTEAGRLVSKDRFLEEVWRGVPVTDEALTQCIKTLRKCLQDDATSPRFIETVPKHGYRFIAAVASLDAHMTPASVHPFAATPPTKWTGVWRIAIAGTLGSAFAGLTGGLFYGFAGTSAPLQPGMGAASVLLVLVSLTILLAMIGGAGVSFGIALASLARSNRGWWQVFGGACGGIFVGAFAKLLGLDAFTLLLGQSPGDITGAAEGAALGIAAGMGTLLAASSGPKALSLKGILLAALVGAGAGVLVVVQGGRLLGGSLDLLSTVFPQSRLRLDQVGALFGEDNFGPVAQMVTGGFEGLLFVSCIAGAIQLMHRLQVDPGFTAPAFLFDKQA